MLAAISEDPLTSSEKDNNNNGIIPRRPKDRQVSSRYMSHSPSSSPSSTTTTTTTSTSTSTTSSSSRRFSSPLLSHSTNPSTPLVPKCSQSVDRRHPCPSTRLPEAIKLLVTSTRSLSVFPFKERPFPCPLARPKPPLPQKVATPEQWRATTVKGENSRLADQHRWPTRTRQVDHLSKSVDVSDKKKIVGNGFGKVVRD